MGVIGATSPATVTVSTAFHLHANCVCGDETAAVGACEVAAVATAAVVTTTGTDNFTLICVGKWKRWLKLSPRNSRLARGGAVLVRRASSRYSSRLALPGNSGRPSDATVRVRNREVRGANRASGCVQRDIPL